MAERVRLQKAIAHAGLMSRRAAEELIADGRVTIEGRKAVLGDRVDVASEQVAVDGAPLPINPERRTHLLYKPVGVISSADDPQGRTTVVDLVGSETRLYPVGRLDYDSEGLILLSNDGTLTEIVTHPRYGIEKTYLVEIEGEVRRNIGKRLTDGVDLDDGPAKAVRAHVVGVSRGRSQIEMVMGEGRNREIRRMMEVFGYPVARLVRTAIGPITDPDLKPGRHRTLSASEVSGLLASAKMKP